MQGPNNWYALTSDPKRQLNMYMQTFDDNEQQAFWTNASVQFFNEDGSLEQSMLIETVDHTAKSVSCESIGAKSPCVANGAVKMQLNGEDLIAPGGIRCCLTVTTCLPVQYHACACVVALMDYSAPCSTRWTQQQLVLTPR